ncbi:MAG: hypothetical protein RJB09_2172, partial [Pseudomonadota bacterium]
YPFYMTTDRRKGKGGKCQVSAAMGKVAFDAIGIRLVKLPIMPASVKAALQA